MGGIQAPGERFPALGRVENWANLLPYLADPISELDEELGYPCYITSSEQWETTIAVIGEKPRAYVGLSVTAHSSLFGLWGDTNQLTSLHSSGLVGFRHCRRTV